MTDPDIYTLIKLLPRKTFWKRRPGKHPAHVKRQLKRQHVEDHLNGLYAVGLCPIAPGTAVTRVGLLDLDNHSDDDIDVRKRMHELTAASLDHGLQPTCFTSSGGKGVHVYFLWGEPQDAHSVRHVLDDLLADCLLLPGTGGLEKNQVEVYPKQDRVPEDGFGSMFILPYAGKSEWLGGSWQLSEPVEVVEVEEHVSGGGEYDEVLIAEALDAIPNDDLDYDEWRNVLFAVHAATGGAGIELARQWSARSAKHDDTFFEQRVWPYIKVGKGITADTLMYKAREQGWQGDVLAQFEDLDKDSPGEDDGGSQKKTESPGRAVTKTAKAESLPALKRDKLGRIEATVGNLEAALDAAMTGWQLGFDEFMQAIMLRQQGGAWVPFRETDNVRMRIALEKRGFKVIAKEALRDVVLKVAERHTFDSAQDWLGALAWDGRERVGGFLSRYFGAEDSAYSRAVSMYWWSAQAGRVMSPGIQTDMVPVLVGPQGAGKSTALLRLVPDRSHLIEIDLTARDADLSRIMQGALIGEIAELRGLNSREDEHIKAFVTRTQEKWVPKYQEYPRTFDRRLLFIGTTNFDEFLSDVTGNRRWLPIRVGAIDRNALDADREQLWAEGLHLFGKHGVMYYDAEALGREHSKEFEIEDPWTTTIERFLRDVIESFDYSTAMVPRVSSTEILFMSGIMPDVGRISRGHQMRLARIMAGSGWSPIRLREHGRQIRGWEYRDELA